MYVDGHCPHYSWEHSFDLAPSATCVIAVLLDELRADAKPGGKQSAKGNKRDNISPVTGKPRGPILAPTSHALPLPACVVAGLVLPAKDAFTLAPEATAQHMQPGGKLHFAFLEENRGEAEELLLEQQRQAEEAAEAAAAAEAAERRRRVMMMMMRRRRRTRTTRPSRNTATRSHAAHSAVLSAHATLSS